MENPQNRRRSERVMLRMSLLVFAEDEERRQLEEAASSQVVNAHGGLLQVGKHLHVGQPFRLKNPRTNVEVGCRVVRIEEAGKDYFHVAFEFERPSPGFWPIVFPPADWSSN